MKRLNKNRLQKKLGMTKSNEVRQSDMKLVGSIYFQSRMKNFFDLQLKSHEICVELEKKGRSKEQKEDQDVIF